VRDQGLTSIDYNFTLKTATLVYEPDVPYEIGQITAYVDDMSEKKAIQIDVYEGTELMHQLRRKQAGWSDVNHGI
jgi:hypothetical protein